MLECALISVAICVVFYIAIRLLLRRYFPRDK